MRETCHKIEIINTLLTSVAYMYEMAMCMQPAVILSRFKRCKRGATAIEFAFVFPIFLFIILGLFELGLIAYTSVALESIVTRVGREASIGSIPGTGPRSERVRALIMERARPLIGSENIQIDDRVLSEDYSSQQQQQDWCNNPPDCTIFVDNNGNDVYDPPGTGGSFGGASQVVEITVRLPWRANFGFVRDVFGENGITPIFAVTIVKNEPDDSSY